MKKPPKSKRLIPVKQYKAAFMQYFECAEGDFLIKEYNIAGSCLARFNKKTYCISSYNDIRQFCKMIITEKHLIDSIPIDFWLDLVEGVHTDINFYGELFREIEDQHERNNLNLALNIVQATGNTAKSFWSALKYVDDLLFLSAMIAATKVLDFEVILSEVTEMYIHYGNDLLNEFENGIFEHVEIGENLEADDSTFFIYSVDDVKFDHYCG
ncbi:hypothetical protein GCM10009122_23440 [Fulvivirga kasyanovii]|uniref:Uncharacterized protein n=1 Tax=Fulvivirga kasyanovii TaxID=396812 RepID=A0ABW9S0C9_9BACT|nr:hypothetical protein [Fulvivirga kasyanovii]MTI28950.1 hypothetical protein [Fulvivirga kasyanovii]